MQIYYLHSPKISFVSWEGRENAVPIYYTELILYKFLIQAHQMLSYASAVIKRSALLRVSSIKK